MGPKLTDKELKEIDKIAKTYGNNYKIKYKTNRPSLVKLKRIYEEAINPDPDIGIDSEVIPFVEPSYIKKFYVFCLLTQDIQVFCLRDLCSCF